MSTFQRTTVLNGLNKSKYFQIITFFEAHSSRILKLNIASPIVIDLSVTETTFEKSVYLSVPND